MGRSECSRCSCSVVAISLVVLVLATSRAEAQCDPNCIPSSSFEVDNVWFYVIPGTFTSAENLTFSQAMSAWERAINNQAGSRIMDIRLVSQPGSGAYTVSITASIEGGALAAVNVSDRTLVVTPQALVGNTWKNIARHEIGHTLGFNHVLCQPSASVMVQGGGASTLLTCNDYWGINVRYAPAGPPPPATGESPIILNLDGSGFDLSRPEVPFDIDADGLAERLSWTREGSGDGFLAMDRNGNDVIDDGTELFGNHTPLSWDTDGPVATHGFEVLAWFDRRENGGNGDHWIDASDAVFTRLRVWIDANHNGLTDGGELATLPQARVLRVSTDAELSRRRDEWGNEFRYRGHIERLRPNGDRVIRKAFDVFLVTIR